jgi:tRNA threonylcarbamoyladenosine biosynthesis protein TsaE
VNKRQLNGAKGGEIILLVGDLGAGKTTFVKGVAKGLGITKVVNSPTFVLMKIYEIKNKDIKIKNLIHIDTYRGLEVTDLHNIGAIEFFKRTDCVSFVEWGAGLEEYFKFKKIKYQKITINNIGENERDFKINN